MERTKKEIYRRVLNVPIGATTTELLSVLVGVRTEAPNEPLRCFMNRAWRDLPLRAAARLRAANELYQRIVLGAAVEGQRLGASDQVAAWMGPRMTGLEQEEFHVLLLDSRQRIKATHMVARGHLTGVEVHPREVFREAVRAAAHAVVLVHNHPSGDPTPSPEDGVLTDRLVRTGVVVGIEVVDHIILAGDRHVSMRGLGWPA